MIDLHCHVLPGIDDGPPTIEESIELARAAAVDGARTIVATPHVSARYDNAAHTITELVDGLNARLHADDVGLEIRTGAEIALTHALQTDTIELARLALGRGTWLLIEPPFSPVAAPIGTMIQTLMRRGHRVVLAHPERCPAFHREPEVLADLIRGGALSSVTAGSLNGRFGGQARRFAERLWREGLVHNLASDAHDLIHRPPALACEIRRARLDALGEWLTVEVPSAILEGGELPRRPLVTVTSKAKRARGLLSLFGHG